MPPADQATTTLLRIPAGLSGPDITALRRLLLAEVRRPGVERVRIDLRATTAARRLGPLVAEVATAAREAGVRLEVDPPRHPAARAEFARRSGAIRPAPSRPDDAWAL